MQLARRDFLQLGTSAAALPSLGGTTMAQDVYPSLPIRLIVGFTPGAGCGGRSRRRATGASSPAILPPH
jgi:tripartite-type tricarboxylate transporter receptor subunit TctC